LRDDSVFKIHSVFIFGLENLSISFMGKTLALIIALFWNFCLRVIRLLDLPRT
jgi:hypothetical protein